MQWAGAGECSAARQVGHEQARDASVCARVAGLALFLHPRPQHPTLRPLPPCIAVSGPAVRGHPARQHQLFALYLQRSSATFTLWQPLIIVLATLPPLDAIVTT
jgi:hypothetical protein